MAIKIQGVRVLDYDGASASNTNIAVGASALNSTTTGVRNVAVGTEALFNCTTAGNNVALGYQAGRYITGSNNVVIGGYNGNGAPISNTGSGYIVLSDGAGNIRVVSDPSGNVGIGNNAPAHKLSVNGTSYFQGNVVILSGAGLSANGGFGTANQSLLTNGSAIYWGTPTAVAAPAGSNTEFQYNNSGVTGGASGLTYDNTSNSITVTTRLNINGVYSTSGANALSQTLTDAATINWDTSLGQIATVTLTDAGRTMAAPTNLKVGTYILNILQDGAGNRTITTWNSVFKWSAGVAPVLSTAASSRDIVSFFSDGTNLYGSFLPDVK